MSITYASTLKLRDCATTWRRNSHIQRLQRTQNQAYEGLKHGKMWKKEVGLHELNAEAIKSLSRQNIEEIEHEVHKIAKHLNQGDQPIQRFLDRLSSLKWVAKAHTNKELSVIQPLTERMGMTQQEISSNPTSVLGHTNAQASDIKELANQSFIFFKLQLDPKEHSDIRYHRSGLGQLAYVFSLEDTGLLQTGHVYTVDPVFICDGQVESKKFDERIFSKGRDLPPLLRSVDDSSHRYPSGKSALINPLKKIFYGKDIIKGIGLCMLLEAYRMDPEIYSFLTNAELPADDKLFTKTVDTLQTIVLKVQGLLPGKIYTSGAQFGHIGFRGDLK